jgi:hypothetical protein
MPARLLDSPVRPLLRELTPEPARFWVRYTPRRWPGPPGPWLDLAGATFGEAGDAGDPTVLERLEERPLDGLLYLPPVPASLAAARDRLAARQASRGTPVLVQLLPGDRLPAASEPLTIVWDLTPVALAAAAARPWEGGGVGPGAAAAWPLLPGAAFPDGEGLLGHLAAAGVQALQGVALDLAPRRLRELGEGLPEARYLALFHGAPPDLGELARAAAAAGLAPLLQRPLPRPPLRGAGNLRLAAALAGAGELCLRLGATEPRAQALLRAARFAERSPHDLEALAREGNLGVLPWLDGEARRLVEVVTADPAAERRLLLARATAPAGGGGGEP